MAAPDGAGAGASGGERLPWVERHRPQTFAEIISHEHTINTLQRFIRHGTLPHLLFFGPPGTGKTTTVHAIVRQIHGSTRSHMVLDLNASDDRGIDVVRNIIKIFCETLHRPVAAAADGGAGSGVGADGLAGSGGAASGAAAGPAAGSGGAGLAALRQLKFVILDEADQMTKDAQMALRRIVETNTASTRFFVLCNYPNKIIPALQSRCTKFRFPPLAPAQIAIRTRQVVAMEKLNLTEAALNTLVKISRGDMRRVLNTLQSAAMNVHGELCGNAAAGGAAAGGGVVPSQTVEITDDLILETAGFAPAAVVQNIVQYLTCDSFAHATHAIRELVRSGGYDLSDLIAQIYDHMLTYDLPASSCVIIYPRLAAIEQRLALGTAPFLEIGALVASFVEIRHDLVKLVDTTS